MISGEHKLWDAHLVTGHARAQATAFAHLAAHLHHALVPVFDQLRDACARIGASLRPLLDLLPEDPVHPGHSPSRARAPGDPRQETDDQFDLT